MYNNYGREDTQVGRPYATDVGDRLPKVVFYWESADGTRRLGRPKKRYKDHLKDTFKKCQVNPGELETLSSDSSNWRQLVKNGRKKYKDSIRLISDQMRLARHNRQTSMARETSLTCQQPECDARSFRTAAGLMSHTRAHQRALQRRQRGGCHVRIEGLP